MGVTDFDAVEIGGVREQAKLWRGYNDSESTLASASWTTLDDLAVEIEDDGFVLGAGTDEIEIDEALDGKILQYDVRQGIVAASVAGTYSLRLQRDPGNGSWEIAELGSTASSTGAAAEVRLRGYRKLVAGEKYRVQAYLSAGTADLDLSVTMIALLAI